MHRFRGGRNVGPSARVALGAFVVAIGALIAPSVARAAAPKPGFRAAYEKALGYYDRGSFEDAIAVFTKAFDVEPRPEALFMIARCHDKLKREDAAVTAYLEFLKMAPEHAKAADARAYLVGALTTVGNGYIGKGDYVRARAAFERASEIVDASVLAKGVELRPAVLAGLGEALAGLGEKDRALLTLTRAMELSMPAELRARIERTLRALGATGAPDEHEGTGMLPDVPPAPAVGTGAAPVATDWKLPPPVKRNLLLLYVSIGGGAGVAVIVAIVSSVVAVNAARPDYTLELGPPK